VSLGAHVLLRRRVTDRDLLVPLITDRMTALAFSILAGAAALCSLAAPLTVFNSPRLGDRVNGSI